MLTSSDEIVAATLDEPFRSWALRAYFLVQKHFERDLDVQVVLRDGYRDPVHQQQLFEQGRRKSANGTWEIVGKIVTRARPNVGPHCYRRAVHIVLLNPKTHRWLADRDAKWDMIGEKAHEAGLRWLGDDPQLRDMAHIEHPKWQEFAKNRDWKPMGPTERTNG